MATLTTRTFGALEVDASGAYLKRESNPQGRTQRPSLFVGEGLERADLTRVAALIDGLGALDTQARTAIAADFDLGDDGVVASFVAFHLEELDPTVVRSLFGDTAASARDTLTRLEIVGLGVHHNAPHGFTLVVDYSFGKDHTDELLAVSFTPAGQFIRVSHES